MGLQIGIPLSLTGGGSGGRKTLALDFTTGVLDSRITASGGANGTITNVAGSLVAGSAPRFTYDPVTHALSGLLIEEARTNLLLNSLINGTNLATQSVTVTAQAYSLTFYGTGSIALSGAFTGTLAGTGAYPTRVRLTFTPVAGTLTLTVTGTVQYAQLEAGGIPTSFIPTAGAAVTRSFEDLLMTGTNFSSWYNPSSGTLIAQGVIPYTGGPNFPAFACVDDGTGNNAIEWSMWDASAQSIRFAAYIANAGIWNVNAGTYVAGNLAKLAGAYSPGKQQAAFGGALGTAATNATIPTVNRMRIGGNRGNSYPLNGILKRLDYYNYRLSDALLQSLST